jgi:hypothetical protein
MAKSAAPILLGVGALALLASGKKKAPSRPGRTRHGVFVSDDCSELEIRDQEKLRNFINGAYRELRDSDPELDWFDLTDALFGDIAPDCEGYPDDPQSADVAEFYAFILRSVAYKLIGDKLGNILDIITDDRVGDFGKWYKAYGGGLMSDLPKDIPDDQVGFSPDYTKSYVGPKWESKTLIPYMKNLVQAGSDKPVEMFMRTHNVALGRNFVRFIDLPEQEPNVQALFEQIHAAFNTANS